MLLGLGNWCEQYIIKFLTIEKYLSMRSGDVDWQPALIAAINAHFPKLPSANASGIHFAPFTLVCKSTYSGLFKFSTTHTE